MLQNYKKDCEAEVQARTAAGKAERDLSAAAAKKVEDDAAAEKAAADAAAAAKKDADDEAAEKFAEAVALVQWRYDVGKAAGADADAAVKRAADASAAKKDAKRLKKLPATQVRLRRKTLAAAKRAAAKKAAEAVAQKAARDRFVYKEVKEACAHISPAAWFAAKTAGYSEAAIEHRKVQDYVASDYKKYYDDLVTDGVILKRRLAINTALQADVLRTHPSFAWITRESILAWQFG